VHPAAGAALLIGLGLVSAALELRARTVIPPLAMDAVVAVLGAGMGIGALLFQDHISTRAWILVPIGGAALAVWHMRALFAKSGPLRI
jgi:hypothetical protein